MAIDLALLAGLVIGWLAGATWGRLKTRQS